MIEFYQRFKPAKKDISDVYREPTIEKVIPDDMEKVFYSVKLGQIKHLLTRFASVSDLQAAARCSGEDLVHWNMTGDPHTGRFAGEMPRQNLACVLTSARFYGVILTPTDRERLFI